MRKEIILPQENQTDPWKEIMERYQIPPLPSLSSEVLVMNNQESIPLSLREALSLPPEKILEKPLSLLSQQEDHVLSQKKPGGGSRSEREKKDIREHYENERQKLKNEIPGRVLAAIAENSGKGGKWTENGLTGDEEWVGHSEENFAWWKWIYEQRQKKIDVTKWWENDHSGSILHAVFIMRVRLKNNIISMDTFSQFTKDIMPLIPEEDEEFINCLREIAKRFPSYFSVEL